MDAYEPFLSLGLATAAGLLIGLEREQSAPADRAAESFLGGARTHPLAARTGRRVALARLAREQVLVSYWGPAGRLFLERVRGATEPIVLDVVTTEDAPFWQVQSPLAKEGPGGE